MHLGASKRLSTRSLLCLVAFQAALCHGPARANTIVAIKRAKDFVIVAVDSRAMSPDGTSRDYEKCKIHLLDFHNFFVAAGVVSNKPSARGEIEFSADEEASLLHSSGRPLNSVAEAWARAMEAKYYAEPDSWKEAILGSQTKLGIRDGSMITGLFGTSDPNIDAWYIEINSSVIEMPTSFHHSEPKEIPNREQSVTLFGTNTGKQVAAELLRGQSPAAEVWAQTVRKETASKGYSGIDAYALQMQRALEAAIATKLDPTIGGDVAVAILERGKQVRWFAKTTTCKD